MLYGVRHKGYVLEFTVRWMPVSVHMHLGTLWKKWVANTAARSSPLKLSAFLWIVTLSHYWYFYNYYLLQTVPHHIQDFF